MLNQSKKTKLQECILNTFYEGMIYVSHETLEIKHLFQEQLYKIIYLKYTAKY